jgi:hypothetical protein
MYLPLQVIYMARNPRDVIVSYFNHHKLFHGHGFLGDLELFAQYFMNDEGNIRRVYKFYLCRLQAKNIIDTNIFIITWINITVYYSPYFPHLLDAWSKRNHHNMLFLFYEDLRKVRLLDVLIKRHIRILFEKALLINR